MIDEIYERYPDQTFLKADGYDSAILGVEENSFKLIYSVQKCLDVLCKDMPYEDALEYFQFNVSGAYLGELTPIWCWNI